MAITNRQVATLRAQLAGDVAEHRRLFAELNSPEDRTEYTALFSAAFCEAVARRFADGSTRKDVVEFVGDVRSRIDNIADEIDPLVAERLILAVYTDEQIADIEKNTRYATQALLLAALISDEHLDTNELDNFMAQARKLADRWLAK